MRENTGRELNLNHKKGFDFKSLTIVYLLIGLLFVLSVSRENFLNFDNIHSILYGASLNFFAAIGFTFLIIMGELDMSVGSLYGFGGAMMSYFVFTYDMPVGFAILLAMAIAGLIGVGTGFLVVKFRLNSMMVTIGVMTAVKGLNWLMVNNFGGRQLPKVAREFISADIMGIQWPIILMIVAAVVIEVFLLRSRHLKQLYYIGHNMQTTIMYGIKAGRVKITCFALSAALSAFGGCLTTARLAHPDVTVGGNLEISIITAAVISGASIFGGSGSMVRTMLGVIFLFALQNGLTAFGVDSYVQQIVVGAILIGAIYLDLRIKRRGDK